MEQRVLHETRKLRLVKYMSKTSVEYVIEIPVVFFFIRLGWSPIASFDYFELAAQNYEELAEIDLLPISHKIRNIQ